MSLIVRLAQPAAFVLLAAFVIGFALFIREARTHGPDQAATADAVVVLTGGGGRLAAGVGLLMEGKGSRLLISGVNPGSPPSDIAAAAGAPGDLLACCIDMGDQAANTEGNAAETAGWVRARGYESVIVVTSDYHMPRALLELKAALPETRLIAYAVPAPEPWRGAGEARRWLQEYVKYAAVYARERAAGRPVRRA